MTTKKRLTEIAHETLKPLMDPKSLWVDATVGNGFDTLFLAQHSHYVYGLDIQGTALENVADIITEKGFEEKVQLILCGHESMTECLPPKTHGSIQGIMFNLGYCPGGDKRVVTRTSTTMAAMRTCPHLIQAEGYLSIIMYPGHPEGQDEANTLKEWIQTQDDFSVIENIETSNNGPHWILLQKKSVI